MIWKTTSLIAGLFFILNPLSIIAQNYDLINLEYILSDNNKSSTSLRTNETEDLRGLMYDLHPTLAIENQEIKSFGEGKPLKAEIYPNSEDILTTSNVLFNSVELLLFKLNTSNATPTPIDISNLKSFRNLRFIYVECNYNCSTSMIKKMFLNTGNIPVLYQITTPE